MVVMVDNHAAVISQHDYMPVLCMHRYTQMTRPSDETLIKYNIDPFLSNQFFDLRCKGLTRQTVNS